MTTIAKPTQAELAELDRTGHSDALVAKYGWAIVEAAYVGYLDELELQREKNAAIDAGYGGWY